MNNISTLYDFDLFINFNDILSPFHNLIWPYNYNWPYLNTIHIATAGGLIPKSIYTDPFHQEFRKMIINSNQKYDYKINPYLDEILSIKSENYPKIFDREAYLKDFIFYAKKGLFSFDRTFISNPENINYHLVAYPIISIDDLEFINFFKSYFKIKLF